MVKAFLFGFEKLGIIYLKLVHNRVYTTQQRLLMPISVLEMKGYF